MYKILENDSLKTVNIKADKLDLLLVDIASSLKEFVFGNITTKPIALRNIYMIEYTLEELIIQWIGELNRQIVHHDWIFNDFRKLIIKEEQNKFTLRADLTGEGVNSGKHKMLYDTTYLNIKNLSVEKNLNEYIASFDFESY